MHAAERRMKVGGIYDDDDGGDGGWRSNHWVTHRGGGVREAGHIL